jgi:hypothetical protein
MALVLLRSSGGVHLFYPLPARCGGGVFLFVNALIHLLARRTELSERRLGERTRKGRKPFSENADLPAPCFARWFLHPKVSTFPAKSDSIG